MYLHKNNVISLRGKYPFFSCITRKILDVLINSIHANISHHKNVSLLGGRLDTVSDTSWIRFFAVVQGALMAERCCWWSSRRVGVGPIPSCCVGGGVAVLASSRRSMSPRPPNDSSYRLETTMVRYVLSFLCSSNYITLDFSRCGQIYSHTCMPSWANVF